VWFVDFVEIVGAKPASQAMPPSAWTLNKKRIIRTFFLSTI
jgi:hypothetical protein